MCPPAYMVPKDPSLNRVKPRTEKVLVLDEHLHIEYKYYLYKLCMSSVRLVDIHRLYGLPDVNRMV